MSSKKNGYQFKKIRPKVAKYLNTIFIVLFYFMEHTPPLPLWEHANVRGASVVMPRGGKMVSPPLIVSLT